MPEKNDSFLISPDDPILVTGASGFIGANLVHELVARGHEVKALLRPGADLRGLAGAEFKAIGGDVSDRERLVSAMRGCDWCFRGSHYSSGRGNRREILPRCIHELRRNHAQLA